MYQREKLEKEIRGFIDNNNKSPVVIIMHPIFFLRLLNCLPSVIAQNILSSPTLQYKESLIIRSIDISTDDIKLY